MAHPEGSRPHPPEEAGRPERRGFPLGQTVATPGALAALSEAQESPLPYLARHARGDWGEVGPEDWRANNAALVSGDRLLSAYTLAMTKERLWIITEADRSYTTLLLPEEY